MSFTITFFGPRHYFWHGRGHREEQIPRVWFYRPDEYSTGGAGFCVPFLHVCFTWGRR